LFAASSIQAQPATDLRNLSGTLETLSEAVSPAIVQIFATGYAAGQGIVPSNGALLSRQQGSGSGVVLDSGGYVVTNAHVVANASRIQVELPLTDTDTGGRRSVVRPRGELVRAQVVGVDLETDLAVLKLQVDRPLAALELGDSEELKPGELVMAFGSPLGLANSVSLGVVSAVARQLRADDPMIYIQTDASINPGNSGGPLVDVEGRVVGINTFILSQSGGSEGIGFAVPSNIVRTVYEQIRQFGRVRRGEIGVHAQTITPELARGLGLSQNWGVVLADVYPGGPGETAGLRIGDLILTLDGKTMENARQFQVNLYPRRVGESLDLDVLRGTARLAYSVTPIERRSDPDRFEAMVRPEEHLIPKLGILALNLTPEVSAMLPNLRQPRGVVVAVSSARAVPVRGEPLLPGDVIHALNSSPVGSLLGLRTALGSLGPGDPVVLQVERSGQLLYVTLTLD
jgi:serine protease Do